MPLLSCNSHLYCLIVCVPACLLVLVEVLYCISFVTNGYKISVNLLTYYTRCWKIDVLFRCVLRCGQAFNDRGERVVEQAWTSTVSIICVSINRHNVKWNGQETARKMFDGFSQFRFHSMKASPVRDDGQPGGVPFNVLHGDTKHPSPPLFYFYDLSHPYAHKMHFATTCHCKLPNFTEAGALWVLQLREVIGGFSWCCRRITDIKYNNRYIPAGRMHNSSMPRPQQSRQPH